MFQSINLIKAPNGVYYQTGNRVRVLKKNGSEYIGIIEKINADGFLLATAPDDKDVINFEAIEKMRIALPGENFLERWNF